MLFFEMLKKLKKKRRKTKRNKTISLATHNSLAFLLYLTSKLSVHLKFGKPLMSKEYKRIL